VDASKVVLTSAAVLPLLIMVFIANNRWRCHRNTRDGGFTLSWAELLAASVGISPSLILLAGEILCDDRAIWSLAAVMAILQVGGGFVAKLEYGIRRGDSAYNTSQASACVLFGSIAGFTLFPVFLLLLSMLSCIIFG
jgi:hypothetical protein